jgi:hypothetical protein
VFDTGNYYIKRRADGLWFTGFDADNTPRFGTENEAKPYATELEAAVQIEFLPGVPYIVRRE